MMPIEFTLLDDIRTIVITASGDVGHDEVRQMRTQTMSMLADTGYRNFLVDMRRVRSIVHGDDFATYSLGERFADLEFPADARTAVILPTEPRAREQAKFLHTVEVNRGRPALRYVEDLLAAKAWFAG